MTVYKHFYAADKLFANTSHTGTRVLKWASVSAGQTYDLQQQEEQGHNVQVEVESSEHVFLWRDLVLLVFPTQDELSVEHQILQRGEGGGCRAKEREDPCKAACCADEENSGVPGNRLHRGVKLKNTVGQIVYISTVANNRSKNKVIDQ